jgi:hypothetical protein
LRSSSFSCDEAGLGCVTSVGLSRLAASTGGGSSSYAASRERVVSGDVGGLDRVAANERLFLRLVKSQRGASAMLACECTSPDCNERIAITPAQYQPVRSSAARYVVSPGDEHVHAKLDQVVDTQPRYWVVEREPSVEMIAFYSPLERTVTSGLSVLADEERPAGRLTLSAVPMDHDGASSPA